MSPMLSFIEITRTFLKLVLGKGVRKSYSQSAEDLLIESLLEKVTHGTYVDVGAYHPILYSNTYGLYRRGWRGVAIDANNKFNILYKVFRSRDRFVCVGVGNEARDETYYRFSDPAYNTFDKEDAETRKKSKYPHYLGQSKLRIRPLRDILPEQGITHIDFMSIDIEGLDMEALESHDWTMPPKVIVVEDLTLEVDHPERSAAYTFLLAKGYRPMVIAGRTIVCEYRTTSAVEVSA